MTTTLLERVMDGEKVDLRNVYQRKLAVMAKCGEIKPDATHAGFGFTYNSVQHISNKLRQFAVEEGLDITTSAPDGHILVVLTNADEPTDQIRAEWPLVPNDKAWAYSSKYALIRTFLIGDDTEGDEAENAAASGTTTTPTQTAPAPRRPSTERWAGAHPPKDGKGSLCPFCAAEGFETSSGGKPSFWVAAKGPHAGALQCNGRTPDGGYANHLAPTTDEENAAAAGAPDFDFEGR
jgi:hypothetical protein